MIGDDDQLQRFEREGPPALSKPTSAGYVENDGAHIWYGCYGVGKPVVLLHGGLGNSGDWSYQIPALLANGYRAVLIDSRGHGRSTRDARLLTYEGCAADVVAVLTHLEIDRAAFVGWSDGAVIALILAMRHPQLAERVFFFGGNMDSDGLKPKSTRNPVIGRSIVRRAKDYARLSSTPHDFARFVTDVGLMTQALHYPAWELSRVSTSILIAHAEFDEFIKLAHSKYLAHTIPSAQFTLLPAVSHFAPLQKPSRFNDALLAFLENTSSRSSESARCRNGNNGLA